MIARRLVAVVSLLAGACFAETKAITADVSYEAQQVACVDKNDTRETIDRCRMQVKAAWSTDAAPPSSAPKVAPRDAGTDGAVLVFIPWPSPRLERAPLPPSLADAAPPPPLPVGFDIVDGGAE